MSAKRARRKRREREKGKKKGALEGPEVDGEGEVNGDGETGLVRWEERIAPWCLVRANAKVKSFAFADEEVGGTKGGLSVGRVEAIFPFLDHLLYLDHL